MMWLLRGWKFDEIEDKLLSTEKRNSYNPTMEGVIKWDSGVGKRELSLSSQHKRI